MVSELHLNMITGACNKILQKTLCIRYLLLLSVVIITTYFVKRSDLLYIRSTSLCLLQVANGKWPQVPVIPFFMQRFRFVVPNLLAIVIHPINSPCNSWDDPQNYSGTGFSVSIFMSQSSVLVTGRKFSHGFCPQLKNMIRFSRY